MNIILNKKKKIEGVMLPHFKTSSYQHGAMLVKEQQRAINGSPHKYSQLILKTGIDTLLPNGAGTNRHPHAK